MEIELRDLTEDERDELKRQLQDCAHAWAGRLGVPDDLPWHSRAGHLARLQALALLREALDRTVTTEAYDAAQQGADYPTLGEAWGISRQAARKRWPGVVSEQGSWFGSLLVWERTVDGYRTRYAGHEFEIVRLRRRDADRWDADTRPGWHFTSHPDDPEHTEPLGPSLGRTLPTATKMAEAWLTIPETDRQPHHDTPNVLLALGGEGAAFGGDLAAYPDDKQRRLTVRRYGHEQPVGTITPHFTMSARPDLEPVRIRWIPAPAGKPALPAATTWREAARTLATAVH